jgi:cell division septum initiation protein DivIVA
MAFRPKRTIWPGTKPTAPKPAARKPVQSGLRAAPKAAPAATPQRATLAQQAVYTPPSPNPGPSSTGQGRRTAASANFGTSVNDINRQLLQAALKYGGDPMVGLYNYDDTMTPTAVATNDPNSSLAQIARTMKDNTKGLEDELTGNNTFFSGMHLTRQQDINDLADRDKTQAYRDYADAIAQLTGGYQQARTTYGSELAGANQDDIDYAASQAPQGGPQTPVASQSVATRVPTSNKYPMMQTTGPNAGIAYNIVVKNGKRYKQYADGRPPVPA